MHFKSLTIIFLLLFSLISPVFAGDFEDVFGGNGTQSNSTITLYPSGTDNDQEQLNKALENYDSVYLSAGIYTVTDSIYVDSNTTLSGDKNAIVRVSSISSKYFTGMKGIICSETKVDNVLIDGFQIDGNCDELDSSYADSRSDTAHDCERAIIIKGSSSNFCNNIVIRNMEIYDCFSDGIHVRMAKNVNVYDNFVSNCQHSGIFFVSVINGLMERNEVAGITSDCLRFDNCVECIFRDNVLYSYTGDHNNGATKGWQNGVQIADAGASHGYDASNKPTTTTNIEGYNNTIANCGGVTIWIDSTGKGVENVYVHGNHIVGGKDIETTGVPVQGIDYVNMPSRELSHDVFDSIYKILDIQYTYSGISQTSADSINYEIQETERGKIAAGLKIIGFSNTTIIDGKTYISSPNDVLVKSSVIKNPSLQDWFGGISKINKTVSVKIENGTATATMKVTVKWYNYERDRKTGAKQKGKMQYSNYTFNDSCPAPEVFNTPDRVNVSIDVYESPYRNYTLVSVENVTQQRNEFTYNEKTAINSHLIGEKSEDSNKVSFTKFYSVNVWEGELQHYGNSLLLENETNPDNVSVQVYSVYGQIPTNVNVNYHCWDGSSIKREKIPTYLKVIIMGITLWKLLHLRKRSH